MRWGDHDFVVGVYVFLYFYRPVPHQAGKSDELVCKTGVAVFLVRLSNYFYIDDRVLANGIEAKKGK